VSEAPDVGGLVGHMLAGRYRVLRKLGEGAMGAVYLAEHTRIGRKDAIKVLRDALARDPEAIARFLRGTRNLSVIRHPNVCSIYDFTETDDGLRFMAMEYVEGPTLKEVLDREGVLPLQRAVDIARQIADGLDAAHDVGVVHRDLKPGNIMLVSGRGGREVVKVVDFDIAKGPEEGGEEVTRSGFVVGTPEYMSPEQLMGEPLDGRSDIYALALVLFRMLTGRLPFHAEGTQDIMIARLTSSPMTVADARPDLVVPPALQTALDRALQRKPADRQASAEEFSREIVAALTAPAPAPGAAGPAAPPVPPTMVTPVPVSRHAAAAPPAITPAASVPASAGRRNVALLSGVGAALLAIVVAVWINGTRGNEVAENGRVVLVPPSSDTAAGDTVGRDSLLLPPPDDPPDTAGAGNTRTGGGTGRTGADTATGNRTTPQPPPDPGRLAMSGEDVVDRFLMLTDGVAPPSGRLPGIADTLTRAFGQSGDAGTRRSLALLLAYVEYYRRNDAACRRWIDEIERLGGTVNAAVRALCPAEEP
jgi:predicted Ser/Thr protein kinase